MRLLIAISCALVATGCSREIPENEIPSSIIEKGEPRAGAGLSSSLVVDRTGKPRVAYHHSDLGVLRVASWDGGKWAKQSPAPADEAVETGRQTALVIEGERYYLAYQAAVYQDAAHEFLAEKHVHLLTSSDGETWRHEPVDENSAMTGDFLAMDVLGGKVALAYYDDTNGDLMFSRRNADGKFEPQAVDTEGDVGKYVSLDIDAAGRVHLAYYDASKGALKYAVEGEDGFVVETVAGFAEDETTAAAAGDMGTWVRLRAQPQGAADSNAVAPKLIFYDESNRKLRIAERDGESWKLTTVDNGPFAGTDSDFLWLADGRLVVSYFDAYNLDLKLARRGTNGWATQTIASKGATGMYTSLGILPGGKIGLTAYDLTNGALRYYILPVRQ